MANTPNKVIDVALNEVGYLEKSKDNWLLYGKNCLYTKTQFAGADNYTKYGYEMHEIEPKVMDFPAAWCDAFVDWCMKTAYGVNEAKKLLCGNFNDYTQESCKYYKNKNRFHNRSTKPKIGEQIFFSKTNSITGVYHTGLVYNIDSQYVYTVEGNTSGGEDIVPNGGGVFKKKYSLGNSKIYGYGMPLYDEQDETEVWKWVEINGDWYYQNQKGENKHGWELIKESTGDYWHWYYFKNDGKMLSGMQWINEKLCLFMPEGLLKGALCISDSEGYQNVWDIIK